MKKLIIPIVFALLVALLPACSVINYSPKVILPPVEKTLPKVVKVEAFKDLVPEDDKRNKFASISLTNPAAFATDLSTEVTLAVVNEFMLNGTFAKAARQVDNPDFIIRGKIERFKARTGATTFAIITDILIYPAILQLFGFHIRKHESMVVLTLSVYKPDGTLVKTYTGEQYEINRYSLYRANNTLAITNQANRTLSKAVGQIRDKMIADDIFK